MTLPQTDPSPTDLPAAETVFACCTLNANSYLSTICTVSLQSALFASRIEFLASGVIMILNVQGCAG